MDKREVKVNEVNVRAGSKYYILVTESNPLDYRLIDGGDLTKIIMDKRYSIGDIVIEIDVRDMCKMDELKCDVSVNFPATAKKYDIFDKEIF